MPAKPRQKRILIVDDEAIVAFFLMEGLKGLGEEYEVRTTASAELALEQIALAFGEDPGTSPALAARRALSNRGALLVLDGAEAADDLQAEPVVLRQRLAEALDPAGGVHQLLLAGEKGMTGRTNVGTNFGDRRARRPG